MTTRRVMTVATCPARCESGIGVSGGTVDVVIVVSGAREATFGSCYGRHCRVRVPGLTCNNHSLADKDAPLSVSGLLLMLASSDQVHAFGKEPQLPRAECLV